MLYNCIQFIPKGGDATCYGSQIQQVTCQEIGVHPDLAEDFWTCVGKGAVEEAIRRKRATINGAMKRAFKRECEMEDATGPPPDPSLFLPEELLKPTENIASNVVLEDYQDEEHDEEETIDMSKYLRSSNTPEAQKAYILFLSTFVKCLLTDKMLQTQVSSTKKLKDYLDVNLEAFDVTVYVSCYKHWKTESWRQNNTDSTLTGSSATTRFASKLLLDSSKGSDKYGGWSDEGLNFYNKVMEILIEQRKRDDCTLFEKKVHQAIVDGNSIKKKRKREGQTMAMNNLSNLSNILGRLQHHVFPPPQALSLSDSAFSPLWHPYSLGYCPGL